MHSSLDFIVIGAQKAGTTSLFRYLQGHPCIYMPPEKEAPYFTHPDRFRLGWNNYINTFFVDAPDEARLLFGTVSPQYMADPRAPQRICDQLPRVKLIALMRDPVERARSHYVMACRRGLETRSFNDAVLAQLDSKMLHAARLLPDATENEHKTYVVRGEYGRIITEYLRFFSREQILLHFTHELAEQPQQVLDSILSFVGLPEPYEPSNLDKRYHVGGSKKRVSGLGRLLEVPAIDAVWHLMSGKYRRRIAYWYRQWNTINDNNTPDPLSENTANRIREHYQIDAALLQSKTGMIAPWLQDTNTS
jgi:hypothetical protein